ncbi:hypothetical protein D3C80_2193030 [compost metagenome]
MIEKRGICYFEIIISLDQAEHFSPDINCFIMLLQCPVCLIGDNGSQLRRLQQPQHLVGHFPGRTGQQDVAARLTV